MATYYPPLIDRDYSRHPDDATFHDSGWVYRRPQASDDIPYQDPDKWTGLRPTLSSAMPEPFDMPEQPPRPMDFSEALDRLKAGETVARSGWNGEGMYLFLVRVPEAHRLDYIAVQTADGSLVPWVASHSDLLGTDWTSKVPQTIPILH